MTSTKWVKTITSPFKKACIFFNPQQQQQQQQQQHQQPRGKKSRQVQENEVIDHLHGEVMACAYEDVQVMWSILDKSKPRTCNAITS